jgi:hypothetical protein
LVDGQVREAGEQVMVDEIIADDFGVRVDGLVQFPAAAIAAASGTDETDEDED